MANLLRKPIGNGLQEGVELVQDINQKNSTLEYVGFKLLKLAPGATYTEQLEKIECCVVAVTGKINVSDGKETFSNLGTRMSVFEKVPTDSVYISNDQTVEVEAVTESYVALCYSPSETTLPTKLIRGVDNSTELRGKGENQRLVHNILPDDCPFANSLLVVEVYTESGNSSSYPPHKHDKDNFPSETFLEETYYHEINPPQGFVFQRVYTDDRSLDETMSVENRDVVVVPEGYHPVAVPAGYTSYYLNVMAGPKRIWKFHNDPDHEWILEQA